MQRAGALFAGPAVSSRDWLPLAHGVARQHGPFAVTPLAVDHSAFESYALLVEAGGRRLLYSGDLRAHGRKPRMWRDLVMKPPRDIHALVMEGTTLSRPAAPLITERDVELGLTRTFRETSGAALACYSGHNVDRLVSVFRAARRARRELIVDLYGAAIAAASRATIPQPGWQHVRVLVPHSQRRRIIQREAFGDLARLAQRRVFADELRAEPGRFVVTMRGSMTRDLDRADCLQGAHAIWSMWPGYLHNEQGRRLRQWLQERKIPLSRLHASGHAAPPDLAALASAIRPTQLVPIHTESPEQYTDLGSNATLRADDEWWDV